MWPASPVTWVFRQRLDAAQMELALKHTLNSWPILTARFELDATLRVSAVLPGPGAGWTTAISDESIATVLPIPQKATPSARVFDTSGASTELLGPAPTTVLRPAFIPGFALAAQLTTFSDGCVLALKAAHILVDGHALILFVRDWIVAYAALTAGHVPIFPVRHFHHALVDDHARPPPAEFELPGVHYDMAQSDAKSFPYFALPLQDPLPGTVAPPWSTWRWTEPALERTIRLSAADVLKLHARAQAGATFKVSALDAVLGWTWKLIARARHLPPGTMINLHSCIGLRPRLGLGHSYAGAVVLATSSSVPSDTENPGEYAAAIRQSVSAFTPHAISHELGRYAAQADPAREWNIFFGEHNTHTSSWLLTGGYDLAIRPAWVQSAFPALDGLVIVLEDADEPRAMNVQLWLRDEVMLNLLKDPELLYL
jgi:hypothetical protein